MDTTTNLGLSQPETTDAVSILRQAITDNAAILDLLFMPGDLKPTARSTAPTGWLICDGSAVSRATYDDLFAAIGTTFGTGDGSTTFNLPDLRGRVPVGVDSGGAALDHSSHSSLRTLGKKGGDDVVTLTTSEMPSHNHGGATGTGTTGGGTTGAGAADRAYPAYNSLQGGNPATGGVQGYNFVNNFGGNENGLHTHSIPGLSVPALSISSQGGGGAHENMPPYQVVNWLVKV